MNRIVEIREENVTLGRTSFLLRSGLPTLDDRPVARRKVSVAELRDDWRRGQGEALLRQMGIERRQFLRHWKGNCRNLIERYGCSLADVRWTPKMTLGARLIPELRDGRLTGRVEIDHGTMFAIDDVVGCVFAGAGFLQWHDKSRSILPKPIILATDFHDRFVRYPSPLECKREAARIVAAVPTDERRVRSAASFSLLALDWVHLHEQSHFLLGHPEFLFRRSRLSGLPALDEADAVTTEATEEGMMERRVLEFQADAQALELLFLLNLSEDGRRPIDLLREGSAKGGPSRPLTLKSSRGLATFRRSARILIVAACVVALLFERSREVHDRGVFHPLPSARLLHLLLVGSSLTEEFLGHYRTLAGLAPLEEDEVHKMLVTLLIECQADLSIAALIVRIKDPDLVYDESAASPFSSSFFDDLYDIFGTGEKFDRNAVPLRSAAAKEFADVHELNSRIFGELAGYHKGGRILASRLARITEGE